MTEIKALITTAVAIGDNVSTDILQTALNARKAGVKDSEIAAMSRWIVWQAAKRQAGLPLG